MNSTTHSRGEYLKLVQKRNYVIKTVQIFIVFMFLLLWEFTAYMQWIDPFILSSPSRMVKMFIQMAHSDLATHMLYTVGETIIGFCLGVAIGFFMAVGLWYSDFAHHVASPFLAVANSLPKIALGPVIIVWAGAGVGAIITMAVAISLIVTVMELSHGFYTTDRNMLVTVQSFGAKKAELFKKVVLPANIPVFFQSLKVNMGLSLVGVIAGEFLVSKAGLGYLIVYAGQVFKMDLVMMSVVLLGFIAFALYYFINRMEKLAVKMINHI